MLDRPYGLPVGDFRVMLRVKAKDGSAFRVLEDVVPHLGPILLPQRAMMGAHQDLRGRGVRSGDRIGIGNLDRRQESHRMTRPGQHPIALYGDERHLTVDSSVGRDAPTELALFKRRERDRYGGLLSGGQSHRVRKIQTTGDGQRSIAIVITPHTDGHVTTDAGQPLIAQEIMDHDGAGCRFNPIAAPPTIGRHPGHPTDDRGQHPCPRSPPPDARLTGCDANTHDCSFLHGAWRPETNVQGNSLRS